MAFERLPIFPLPDVVLFPHALLPLHVFEPRYRAMTRDLLAGDHMLSIVRLRPGFEREYDGRPAVYQVAGVGEVVQSQVLPDGRYDILVRGIGRVRIEREHAPVEPYRLVVAQRLQDEYSGADLGVAQAALRSLAERLATALPQGGEVLRSIISDASDPGALADLLAASVVMDPNQRQDLIETLDVGTRLQRVGDAVADLVRRLTPANRQDPLN